MKNSEFSDTFTTLLNSYNTQAQFGDQASKMEIVLDEYEKSVLLTQAQDIIVKSYFDRTLNPQGQGFDDSARRQIDFSSLIKVATLKPSKEVGSLFDDRGVLFNLPPKRKLIRNESGNLVEGDAVENSTEVLFILNEKLIWEYTKGDKSYKKDYVIVPINYREYDREMSKPYAQPLKKQAWRLLQNQATGFDVQTELIPRFNVGSKTDEETGVHNYTANYENENLQEVGGFTYKIRYIRRPRPIVLEDLPDGLEIDGTSIESDCELNPILHQDILNKAVEIAVQTRGRGTPTDTNKRKRED